MGVAALLLLDPHPKRLLRNPRGGADVTGEATRETAAADASKGEALRERIFLSPDVAAAVAFSPPPPFDRRRLAAEGEYWLE